MDIFCKSNDLQTLSSKYAMYNIALKKFYQNFDQVVGLKSGRSRVRSFGKQVTQMHYFLQTEGKRSVDGKNG